jgi:hypothetical protein
MEVTAEQLENEFGVNVFGVIYMTQAAVGVGQMPKGGRIINIGSTASKILVPSLVYTVTKAAQDALTTLLAGEVSLPWCSSPALLRRPSNAMADSLGLTMELPSIHSHPAQFQPICRNRTWWSLTGLQARFTHLQLNRRGLGIASGHLRI